MYTEERQEVILLRCRDSGRVDVGRLAEELEVSAETIRRDLAALERRGLLRRVHGGAIATERITIVEPEMTGRAQIMADEKQRIARAALTALPLTGAIFIEAGSTAAAFAELLPSGRVFTVVTNSLPIALTLAGRPNLTVLTVGGRVRSVTLAEVDDWALRSIASCRVDVAFLGTNGISVEHGLTTPDIAEAAIKRAVLSIGRRTVLMADHSKVGAVSLCRYGELSDLDLFITDSGLSPEAVQEFEATRLQMVIA